MAKRDILKEAIADAKTVKETAIANAKAALEEAFTPQLKSMLAAKLEEMEKEDEKEEADDKVDEAKKDDDKMEERKEYMTKKEKREGDDRKSDNKAETETEKMRKIKEEDVSDLDEILAELENELNEDARTDAEEEGYEDGFKDAKADMKDALTKMKVSELKAKIRENILSTLNEEEEVDVDIDVEDEVEVDAEADDIEIERPGVKTTVDVGLSPEEEIVQDSLKAAMDAAQALGSQKLADQIGNTITFFTREFVVGNNTD